MTQTIYHTYRIAWSDHDIHYYGTRYAKGCQPTDLWKSYFTSSKYVKDFRENHGDPDIIEIRKTFKTANEAREWEHRVLKRLDVVYNEKWLNQTTNKAFLVKRGKESHMYGKPGRNMFGSANPMHGVEQSPETIQKIKDKTSGVNHNGFGKHRTDETKNRISHANAKWWYTFCSPAGEHLTTHSAALFARQHKIHASGLHVLVHGKISQHLGFTFVKREPYIHAKAQDA